MCVFAIFFVILYISSNSPMWWTSDSPKWNDSVPWVARVLQGLLELCVGS